MTTPAPRPDEAVPLRHAVRTWWSVGWQTFGGPAAQIAVMQREFVDQRQWIGQRRFLHALSYCMLLPGPEAMQLATYLGWLLHGTRGALLAGSFFVLPGVAVMLALSAVYVTSADTAAVQWVLAGLAAAVLAIVLQAVLRVGGRALHHPSLVALAVASFVAMALLDVPFPLVVISAALVGLALAWVWPAVAAPPDHEPADRRALLNDDSLHTERGSVSRTTRITAASAALWAVPMGAAWLLFGVDSTVMEQALFFSFVAFITVGGAYAVLGYVSENAVDAGWVTPVDMVRGLALAETTPGPLIMVVQFVAFVGAWNSPGDVDPWVAAIAAALLTSWVTFLPSFWFILVGAPYVERLRGSRRLAAALTGVTAAVVGVIATLGLTFAGTTLFGDLDAIGFGRLDLTLPEWSTLRWAAVAVAAVAGVLVLGLRWPVLRVLAVAGALGLLLGLAGAW
ncbi:MAG: chromate efflux transporter [Nocardioidaceae bacterium]|nr:chromate efflux transporter [Nocardioidaceae bacterium]